MYQNHMNFIMNIIPMLAMCYKYFNKVLKKNKTSELLQRFLLLFFIVMLLSFNHHFSYDLLISGF